MAPVKLGLVGYGRMVQLVQPITAHAADAARVYTAGGTAGGMPL
jgi:hypothetical protein